MWKLLEPQVINFGCCLILLLTVLHIFSNMMTRSCTVFNQSTVDLYESVKRLAITLSPFAILNSSSTSILFQNFSVYYDQKYAFSSFFAAIISICIFLQSHLFHFRILSNITFHTSYTYSEPCSIILFTQVYSIFFLSSISYSFC